MAPIAWIALAYVLGVLVHADGFVGATMVAGSLAIGAALWFRRERKMGGAFGLLVAAFAVGMSRAGELPKAVPRGVEHEVGDLVAGYVVRGCEPSAGGSSCEVESPRGNVLVRAACDARPGDWIEVVATIRPVLPTVNGARWGPGAALLRAGIRFEAIGATCDVEARSLRWRDLPRRIGWSVRRVLEAGIARALPLEAATEARALLFGDTTAVGDDEIDAFRRSGLAHLLAVSGAHVSLLAFLFAWALRSILRWIPQLTLRGALGVVCALAPLPALGVFVLACGESPSSVRALVGAALGALANALGRKTHGESLVAASVLVTAGIDPAIVFNPGWQLSVVAAWALTLAEDPPGMQKPWHALLRAWIDGIGSSVRVAFATSPVLLWHFQRMPVSGLAVNALAAPLAETAALPVVLATGALGRTPIARLVRPIAKILLDTLFALPRRAIELPVSSVRLPPPTPLEAVTMVLAALVALRTRGRARAWVLTAAMVFVVVLEALHLHACRPRGLLRVTVLDVGQGDALLVDLPDGSAMLVDGGGSWEGANATGDRIVVPVLAGYRRRDLVAVVASHPHPDHIGGLASVLSWANVGALWDTRQAEAWHSPDGGYARMREVARSRGIPVFGPETLCGERSFHGAWLSVLAPCPRADPATPPNDASFVFTLRLGRSTALFPGDVESGAESRLLARLGPVTFLKVPHHGSRTSSTEAFLSRVSPRVAVASAGHPSPFGHPHADVVARYARRGISLWTTAESGAVQVTLDPQGRFDVEPME